MQAPALGRANRREPRAWCSKSRLGPTLRSIAGAAKILVAYASKYGSTRGVAERIAERLVEHGNEVEVHSVDHHPDPSAYDAIVLGSPVYGGSWTEEAVEFGRRYRGALAARQVWLFSVGSFGDSHRLWGRLMTREPKEIGDLLATIEPRDYRVFAGAIERNRWPLAGRVLFRAMGGRFGDNRNWPEVDAWAEGLARTLRTSA